MGKDDLFSNYHQTTAPSVALFLEHQTHQKGDLLWIPAGTLLHRPRKPGHDDLFSNWHQTIIPAVALFLEFQSHDKCTIMLDGQNWSVEIEKIRHNIQEEIYAN